MSDLAKFKEDYPDTYEKFLEMNRALSTLMRKQRVTPEDDVPQYTPEELPSILEWE